jgi:hypothetical protein
MVKKGITTHAQPKKKSKKKDKESDDESSVCGELS